MREKMVTKGRKDMTKREEEMGTKGKKDMTKRDKEDKSDKGAKRIMTGWWAG